MDGTGVVVPGGDAVAPPLLATDAPVLDVAHPGEVHVLVLARHEFDVAILHGLDRRRRQGLDLDEPLVREPRLDHRPGAVAAGHGRGVFFDALDESRRLQVGDEPRACLETVQAPVGTRCVVVDAGLGVEDVDEFQAVTVTDGVVVEVVGGCDLDAAGAERTVHVVVRDDGDAPADQRQHDRLADQRAVAFVVGVHRHGGVAQHGLRAGGGDHQVIGPGIGLGPVGQRIAEVPQVSGLLVVVHLEVGDRRLQDRVPVHQPLAPVDQALVVEAHEDLDHCPGEALVHGEAFTAPVHRRAHAPDLPGDVCRRWCVASPRPCR